MKKINYVVIIPALAGLLFLFPAAEPAHAGGSSFGIGFSFSVPYYDPYPSYHYPYGYGAWYGLWDDRPYWRGRHWDRHDHRFFKHRNPNPHYYPRYDRHYGRHFDR